MPGFVFLTWPELIGGTGLCDRRHWPRPQYETYSSSRGYGCVVTVNNREYQTDSEFPSDSLARENAAMRAYLLCRNFSVNDGMYPTGHSHGGVVQGIPTAIGAGRNQSRPKASNGHRLSVKSRHSSASEASSSPGSSPGRHSNSRYNDYAPTQSTRGYGSTNATYGGSGYYRPTYSSGR